MQIRGIHPGWYNHIQVDNQVIIRISDNYQGPRLFAKLRKIAPTLFASRRMVQNAKHDLCEEFSACMRPFHTHKEFGVDPKKLLQMLPHLYYFLPDQEWWCLGGGGGREIHKRKQCAIQLACANNDMSLHGYDYHFTKNIHTVVIFYRSKSMAWRETLNRQVENQG